MLVGTVSSGTVHEPRINLRIPKVANSILAGSSLPKLPTEPPTDQKGDIYIQGGPVAKEQDDVTRSLPNISTPDTSGSEQVVPSLKPRK